ncbi:Putative acyl-CoA synthetase YngI [Geodia barretti]|uniref:Medium-chain acyl-CoA ligase ACSF2, mitochondrial n=1 Tax=Geodia barretti TaxID=519541 RepID=A0AA35S2R2_GEOBA|nr:Putative acyl-CoA synthetase YngI [Geodia barretti]
MTHNIDTRSTIGDILDIQTQRFAEREALVHTATGDRLSYREFHAEVERVARGLLSIGIEKGQHVGIWATNYTEWVIAQFATAKIGAVLVTVNPAYRTRELAYVLEQAQIGALILIGRFRVPSLTGRTSDYAGMVNEVVPELAAAAAGELNSTRFPHLRHVIFIPPHDDVSTPTPPGMWRWDDLLTLAEQTSPDDLRNSQAQCDPDDVVNIQYTSGTTGNPKGAMLTHHNLLSNALHVGDAMEMDEHDRLCIPVPFYHCFGCVMGSLNCVVHGSTMIIPAEHFDPLQTLHAISAERCTAVHGVPTMFIAQLGHPEFTNLDLSSLRTGIMAGSPCPIETLADDSIERRVSTVGKVLPGVEVRLVDPETGLVVGPGQQGELQTRSTMVMKGYFNMPEATADAIDADGWLHTGDLATVDEDGYYKITGRLKDMIIRGGENIYPREIEEFLYTHPQIDDVQVIGVPDERFGEEVMAWVRLKPDADATEESIRDFCRGQIAHYKVPRYVKFTDEFPMTVTGKIQKFRMREMAVEELALQTAAGVQTA